MESGLNDGIATPFVLLFTGLAIAEVTQTLSDWLTSALFEIVMAVVVGAALGMLGGWLLSAAMKRKLTTRGNRADRDAGPGSGTTLVPLQWVETALSPPLWAACSSAT